MKNWNLYKTSFDTGLIYPNIQPRTGTKIDQKLKLQAPVLSTLPSTKLAIMHVWIISLVCVWMT
jgi:hypothetical protein